MTAKGTQYWGIAGRRTSLAALPHTSAVAFQVIKYLGVAYLLYMAWATWRDKGALTVEQDKQPLLVRKVIMSGVLVNLLNPKLTLFFFAFLPQFVPAGQSGAVPHMVGLSAVFMALTFVVFVGYGTFAALIRDRVISRPAVLTWMRRTFAGAFAAMGAKLAFTNQ
ncbi:LysE family translocator [Herbihabitans rhizosphaerae]|uniref:LysE family translocator n=1 Tax=Herbihabitans rhizosphaerae TaxID=1872711 RepID=UPI001F5F9FAE|nr:LysE family translocator [Herbihabitans rhizosphaerae]